MSARDPYRDIRDERAAQHRKWGQQDHPDGAIRLVARINGSPVEWLAEDLEIPTAPRAKANCDAAARAGRLHWSVILVEEVAEAVDAIGDYEALRAELVQVAAVAVAWIEAIDRRKVTRG